MSLYTVTPYGRSGGSSRVRVFDWLDHLSMPSCSLTYANLATNSPRSLSRHPLRIVRGETALRKLASKIGGSALLLSKQASPLSRGGIEAALLGGAAHGVYDFDDALQYEPGHGLGRFFPKKKIWAASVGAADVVIAGNSYLADQAMQLTDVNKIVVIPSCVEPAHYAPKFEYSIQEAPRAIWMGSPGTEPYLQTIAGPLLRMHRESGLRLTVVSSGRASFGDLGDMVDRVEWTKDAARRLVDADFGLMPMPDSPYARGKCAYKLLQYAASALPAIGSAVGENRRATAVLGQFSAQSDRDWLEAMRAIVEMPESERRLLGVRGLSAVAQHYGFAAWADEWISAVMPR